MQLKNSGLKSRPAWELCTAKSRARSSANWFRRRLSVALMHLADLAQLDEPSTASSKFTEHVCVTRVTIVQPSYKRRGDAGNIFNEW